MTREEIEAAASEYRYCYANPTSCDLQEWDRCAHTLATDYVKYLAERQRRIEAAASAIAKTWPPACELDAEETQRLERCISDVITKHLDGETP